MVILKPRIVKGKPRIIINYPRFIISTIVLTLLTLVYRIIIRLSCYIPTANKLTQLSPRSHPRHPVGKRTTQNDAIKDIITSLLFIYIIRFDSFLCLSILLPKIRLNHFTSYCSQYTCIYTKYQKKRPQVEINFLLSTYLHS